MARQLTTDLLMLEQSVVLEGRDVVDIGCGGGCLVRELSALGARVTGIEISAEQLAPAVAADVGTGARYLVGRAQSLPLADASVDVAVFMRALHHIPPEDLKLALSEARRVLRADGEVYVAEPLAEGDYFALTSIVEDERAVRLAAQTALARAALAGLERVSTIDYDVQIRIADLGAFRARFVSVDPDRADIYDARRAELGEAFGRLGTAGEQSGERWFVQPMRADRPTAGSVKVIRMTREHPVDEQRLAFGRVAGLYDRARPSYPPAVVDEVIEFAGLTAPAKILEVGAGTGKATVMFADRGFDVLALEPSHEMAQIARANCARHPGVEVVEVEFEHWRPTEQLPALVCAAAWHWLSPEVRYQRAGEALSPGGTLAAIWTFPDWQRCALRRALSEAYAVAAPQLGADFPMHPDSRPTSLAGDWCAEILGDGRFTAPVVKTFPWGQEYTSSEYLRLLQTHQDHILLREAGRRELLAAVGRAIDRAGGVLRMPFATRLCLATRCRPSPVEI